MEHRMDRSMVAYVGITCVILYAIFNIVQKLGRRRKLMKRVSKFPGPPALPIIGNAHLLIGNREAISQKFMELGELYPSPYRLWLGNYLVFVINTPEQLKAVLLSPKLHNKGDLYDVVRPWLGTGLLTAPEAKWKIHRRLMQPTFSPTILKSFVGIFSSRSGIMAKEMERNLDGPEFEICNYVAQFTLHTICETNMGVDLGADENSDGRYAESIRKLLDGMCERGLSPWLHPDFIFKCTKLGKDQQKYIQFLHKFTDNVIQKKKKELLEQNQSLNSNGDDRATDNGVPVRKVLLDHLIDISRNSETFTDEAIREEVDTIMAAGSDTTAVTNSFVMLMLASHPDIQEKVYREQCEIYKDDENEERHVTSEDLSRMIYLERVIKETMRLFPVSPTLLRSVMEDFVIGEHTLPAGSLVLLSLLEVHRNGDIWPDPLKFDPDRFLPEEVAKRDTYAYLPFSGGHRNCIGMKFAMMSMKTLIATILRRYVLIKDNIKPVEDIPFKWEFLIRPAEPITLRIEKRTKRVSSI